FIDTKESPRLYIHVPFCRQKCLYCDFFSAGSNIADWEMYSKAVVNELKWRISEFPSPPSTIYIGGGTPSLLPETALREIVEGIRSVFGAGLTPKEFTIEINPEDVTEEKALIWGEAGITRVSLGIQSFNNKELQRIGRRHSAERGKDAYNILRSRFSNVSIDLMFGLPLQTMESWRETLREALLLNPTHLSAYSLMLEEKTPLTILNAKGRLEIPDDVMNENMWKELSEMVKGADYEQYEISNYARRGFESIHNSKYWQQVPYVGLGPSAHSYDGRNKRRFNPWRLNEYVSYFSDESKEKKMRYEPFYEEETLSEEELMEEFILTRLRMKEGIDVEEYTRRFGAEAAERLKRNAENLSAGGGIEYEGKK
ncbi:MAG: radical SAM family heme chaperone HemW, partial [Muribaculaceae bacterium]|nr:radical SAM family heme chaperone HemW [Muribaculaceae bacterium]